MPSERTQRQIDRLLDEAEQAMAERDWALLRQHAQDVLLLDADNEDAQNFLTAADRALSPPAVFPLPTPDTQHPIPSSFASGRYQVKRFLGEGGKKRVYLAHDTTLDRDVAFALIKTEGLDQIARERIAREAQAMGRLGTHPHIVTVFDLGEEAGDPHPDSLPILGEGAQSTEAPLSGFAGDGLGVRPRGQPYMVTELMAGGDVEGVIEKAPDHRLPLAQAISIAEQVCQGLEFAHAKGIVHRDLKPGNVWLTQSLQPAAVSGQLPSPHRGGAGGEVTAKIGDFGLAVAIDRTRLTQAGMMVGTVSYMPPEQATGGEVTPRSDLYSLGAMLYELVTGRPPFVGDEAVAIIGQHLNTPPVAPTWHRPNCPPGLEALILRLLEKDPTRRPASASEVREALERITQAALRPSLPASLPRGRHGGDADQERGDGSPPSPLEGEGLGMRGENPLYRRVFVGREQEIRQLQAAFDAALSGKGALAMVVGEPGIGKTAVCEQLATYVTLRGGTTLTGHCYEEGSLSLPYLAFVEALRSYATSRPPEALRAELGSAASDLARIVSEVRERLAVEPRPPGDPEEDRWRLLQAVAGFLRNASAVQPLLLVLEDLHWADQGTLDLLVHLARNLTGNSSGARLLVIGTYRDVEVDRSHPLSATLAELRRGADFSRVLLRGLGTPEVQRMLETITGQSVPGNLAESIHRQTEGNPLFVQEVVRYLVEEGHLGSDKREGTRPSPAGDSSTPSPGSLERGPGGEAMLVSRAPDLATIAIPEGLRDVIGRRIARLSPECNRLLAVAAVIGRDFSLATLETVSGSPKQEVAERLDEAVRTAVLTEQEHVGAVQYRFAHAFFRQTLYEELGAARRIQFHQQVARALEAQYATRLSEHAAELAEHFAHSSVPEDLAKAVRYAEAAAERALSVYAYGEAVRHLEQALDVQEVLDPDDKAKRCDLLLTLGEALVSGGESWRAVDEIAPEALKLAEAIEDRGRASRACRIAHRSLHRTGYVDYQRAGGDRWASLSDEFAAEGTLDRVYADEFLARRSVAHGENAEGERLRWKATHLAMRLNDGPAILMSATDLLQGQSTRPEEHQERLTLSDEVSKLIRDSAESLRLPEVHLFLGEALITWGRREEAEDHWRRAQETALRSRDATMSLVPFQAEALLGTLDGDLERVAGIEDKIRTAGIETGREQGARIVGARAVRRPLLYLGRAQQALTTLRSPEVSNPFVPGGGIYPSQRALCLAHLGQAREASEILHRMMAARDLGSRKDPTPVSPLKYLLEAAVLLGDSEACRVLAERLEPLAGLLHTEAEMIYNIGRLLGGAAALLGETDKAGAYYEQALEICEKVRFRPEIALTRLELAELMLAQADSHQPSAVSAPPAIRGRGAGKPKADKLMADRSEALAHLDFAIAEFRAMKMQPSLERALRHKELLKA